MARSFLGQTGFERTGEGERVSLSCLVALAAAGLVAAGCSSLAPESSVPPSSPSPAISTATNAPAFRVSVPLPERVPATRRWRIACVLKTQTDPYWQRVKQAAIAAGQELAVDIVILGTDQPQNAEFVEEQILAIAQQLERGELDGIVLGPADSLRLVPAIEKAVSQGIPIITIDTPLESDAILTFVGFDNFAAGETIGQWVVQQLGGAGNVLVLEGARHHDNARERHHGFLAGLKTGSIKVLATESANWSQAEAQPIVHRWLAQYPRVDAIVAANDEMALGAIAAIHARDRRNILVTGFDGSQNGIAALQSDQLAATIDQIPEHQTRIAIELMITALERSQSFPPTILLENTKLIVGKNFAKNR